MESSGARNVPWKRCDHTKAVMKRRAKTAKSQPKPDRPFAPGYGIVGAKEGKGLLPWTWVARKMNRCRTFWLATIHVHAAEQLGRM